MVSIHSLSCVYNVHVYSSERRRLLPDCLNIQPAVPTLCSCTHLPFLNHTVKYLLYFSKTLFKSIMYCIIWKLLVEWQKCWNAFWTYTVCPDIYAPNTKRKYNRLSLSRPRLSRITDYLDVKIWSLFKHGNLRTGGKILFFSIYLYVTSGVKLRIHLLKVVVRFIVFLKSTSSVVLANKLKYFIAC